MSITHSLRPIILLALVAAAAACSSPAPEPTGADNATEPPAQATYVGAWMQSVNDGWSTITIAEGPDGLQLSWTAENWTETVSCEQPGVCRSFRGETPQVEYRFRTFTRSDSPFLFVECVGTPLAAGAGAPLRYVDRLELRAGGAELWAHTVEAEGITANPPVRLTRIPD